MNFQRRAVLLSLAATALLPRLARAADPTLIGLERKSGGRLGVFALDSESGRSISHRADERFALCSTFKLLLAAAVLREVDAKRWSLETVLPYGEADMVPHAPVTSKYLSDGGMSIGALAQATQMTSDNVAANLLVRHFGGPQKFTALLREWGDEATRIDRWEPEMNLVSGSEVRDTTTPRAMAHSVARVFGKSLLSQDSQERLRDWMIATDTGMRRIRAGLPIDWIAGDKTGTAIAKNLSNKHNDVAVIWLPKRAPIVVAAYFEASGHHPTMRPVDDAVLAAVGTIVTRWVEAGTP